MKAIVVTDQAAGLAGMTLVERPEPSAAINDVIVEIHASGFVPTEMEWPSTWVDRPNRDRAPSIPGHELAGVDRAVGDVPQQEHPHGGEQHGPGEHEEAGVAQGQFEAHTPTRDSIHSRLPPARCRGAGRCDPRRRPRWR